MQKICLINSYKIYILLLLLLTYLLAQLDRFLLAVVTKPLAQEIHYGDKSCFKNDSSFGEENCTQKFSQVECLESAAATGTNKTTTACKWDYTGQGLDYQLLVGPVFILVNTLVGIPAGFAADLYSRKILLGLSLIFWSVCTICSGFVQNYWQLALLRFGIGFGQAGCNPFSTSLIADYFQEGSRGMALGVYNLGIYAGYSASFGFGDFITQKYGWRFTFVAGGIPGIVIGFLILTTMKEPNRQQNSSNKTSAEVTNTKDTTSNGTGPIITEESQHQRERINCIVHSVRLKFTETFKAMSTKAVLLCIAGSFRNAGGYVWAYNSQLYFEEIGESSEEIGYYMSTIPLMFGSAGVLAGGIISDRLRKHSKDHIIWCLVISQLIAACFAICILLLQSPWNYLCLIPTYLFGEMWVSITLVLLVDILPINIRTTGIAFYFFIITNIGGLMPLFVPILSHFSLDLGFSTENAMKFALLLLFPVEYILGALLFFVTNLMSS